MAGPIWVSVRTVSSAQFKTSLRNPISLHSGRARALLGASRVSQQLFLLIAQAAQGCFHPWSPQIPLSLPRAATSSEAAAGLQYVSPADDGSERPRGAAFGCNCADCVAFPSSLNPAPLIDISGWEAGSLQRALDIKGVFTPPLHQSKLKLICAYMLVEKIKTGFRRVQIFNNKKNTLIYPFSFLQKEP